MFTSEDGDLRQRTGCRGQEGFTLVELLVGMFLAGILLMALGSVLATGQRVQARIQDQAELQRSGNAALERIVSQISLAGLNLDRAEGEAFPDLPPEAGHDWGSAISFQYKEGDSLRRLAYYVRDGRLVQWECIDGGVPRVVPLTVEDVQVTSLSFTYYTDGNINLGDEDLTYFSQWLPNFRSLIRRVDVEMTLKHTGVTNVGEYTLQASVTAPNVTG